MDGYGADQIRAAERPHLDAGEPLMQRAADEELLCFPAHFRRTSAGHVKHDGDAFRYEFIESR